MTAPFRRPIAELHAPRGQGATAVPGASPGECFRKEIPPVVAGPVVPPDPMAGLRTDLHALRRAMPEVFAQVLEEQFRSNEEAALFFDVDERTIRNWKAKRNQPRGHHVLFLIHKRPAAARRLLGE